MIESEHEATGLFLVLKDVRVLIETIWLSASKQGLVIFINPSMDHFIYTYCTVMDILTEWHLHVLVLCFFKAK